jgi:hypothetical protein
MLPAPVVDLAECLQENGIDPSGDQPFDPGLADAAWQACRAAGERLYGAASSSVSETEGWLEFGDCMAELGWIPLVLSADDVPAQYEGLALGCRPRRAMIALAECLREQGVDVPDPVSGDPVAAQPYESATIVPAWEACREEYFASENLPMDVSPGVGRLDCLAEHGWITPLFTRLPKDPTFEERRASCPPGFGP